MRRTDRDIIDEKSRGEWMCLMFQWVHSERDRKMLERHLLDDIKLEPLSEEFELSVNQCQKVIDRAKKQLFKNV